MLTFDADHFTLRTLVPDDARRNWGHWLADPSTAAALNAVPRDLSEAERLQYINSMDNKTAFVFGIFEKDAGELIGIWTVYVDPDSREFLLNVLVEPGKRRNQGALTLSRDIIYRHFFETEGLMAGRINVMASNTAVLNSLRKPLWVIEHRSQTKAAGTNLPIEVCHLRMTREAWRALHSAKQPDS